MQVRNQGRPRAQAFNGGECESGYLLVPGTLIWAPSLTGVAVTSAGLAMSFTAGLLSAAAAHRTRYVPGIGEGDCCYVATSTAGIEEMRHNEAREAVPQSESAQPSGAGKGRVKAV